MGFLGDLFGGRPKITPDSVRDLRTFSERVLESDIPVIVDVWSESCAPCKKMAPVLVNVATKYEGRVRVVEIDTTSEPALLARLGVRATPTLIMFEGGEEIGRMAGFRPEGWFDEMIATEFPEAD
jgi:thioredoxin